MPNKNFFLDFLFDLLLTNVLFSSPCTEILDVFASLQDNTAKNPLLKNLIFQYAQAEKALKKLYLEPTAKQKLLDEDLFAAGEIQKSLLPQYLPKAEKSDFVWKFLPCEHMGGNIFNIIEPNNDGCIVYMLDVSGHGIPATIISLTFYQSLQTKSGLITKQSPSSLIQQTFVSLSPKNILEALNKEYPMERFNKCFSISYLVVNSKERFITYCNGGLPDGNLKRKEKGGTISRNGWNCSF